MKTEKPISTISYNSVDFLEKTLNNLQIDGYISYWCYIRHNPDNDSTKFHSHVYIEPNGRICTDKLRSFFSEEVENNKPLGVMPFQCSEFVNWTLYGIHDIRYLAKKGLTRTFHYSFDDIRRSDNEWFKQNVASIPKEKSEMIYDLMRDGYTPTALLRDGFIKLSDYQNARRAYDDIISEKECEFRKKSVSNDIYFVAGAGEVFRLSRQRLNLIRQDFNETIYDLREIAKVIDTDIIIK